MVSTSDKASGLANEAIGTIKQGVGKIVGSDRLQAEGEVQQLEGEVRRRVGGAEGDIAQDAKDIPERDNRDI